MKRRAFFERSVASIGSLSCPLWLSQAFAQAHTDEVIGLSDAYRRAQRSGKPLLVLVIPEGERRWTRGQWFGELLNHASDATMAELALAELACARLSSLRVLVPQVEDDDALMVWVDPSVVPARVRSLDAELPEVEWRMSDSDAREEAEGIAIDGRIATLSALIHQVLGESDRSLEDYASRARAAITDAERARVESAISRGRIDVETAALAPAMVAASGDARLTPVLTQLGVMRWRENRLPNSRWARSGGCGIRIEYTEEEREAMRRDGRISVGVACGMGHVPERSARFLDWYVHE